MHKMSGGASTSSKALNLGYGATVPTSNVFSIHRMFEGTAAFNPDAVAWCTYKVTTLDWMRAGGAAFKQDVVWDVRSDEL